jgi:hypothetical protein
LTAPRLAPDVDPVPPDKAARARLVDQLDRLTVKLRTGEDYQRRGAEELARLRQKMSELRRRIDGHRSD